MAEEGGITAAEGLSSATDPGYSTHNASQQIHVSKNDLGGNSRQSTFEMLDHGMMTPMTGNKRESKHIMELDDYFVRVHCVQSSLNDRIGANSKKFANKDLGWPA